MKNNKCPNCESTEIIENLDLRGGEGNPPYVMVSEPEPPNRPFIWMPKFVRSYIKASVCGSCGYTELHTINYKEMNETYKKGYRSK
ncbi:MAG: hypothetical protein JNK81_14815 [Anaerolineales bacterium]|nr:hypothetical protein [Anaerolineales bacterium]